MKNKKGFTLIELLAVIIILAIIALIATPIVMNVIERSRKGAAERSAENYIDAVETQVMALRANGTTLSDGTYTIEDGDVCLNSGCTEKLTIEMSGTKPSSGSVVISNGKVVASGANSATTSLTIGDYTATIGSNGSAVATKSGNTSTPRYYSFASSGSISGGLPSDASESAPSGKNFYLAFDSADGETIDAAYVCFTKGSPAVEYCIQGGDSGAAFSDNQGILDTAFPSACSLFGGIYDCNADGLGANASSNGIVDAHAGDAGCGVDGGGSFGCRGN